MSDDTTNMLLQNLLEKTDKQTESLARIETNQISLKKTVDGLVPRVQKIENTQNRAKYWVRGALVAAGTAHWQTALAVIKGIFGA